LFGIAGILGLLAGIYMSLVGQFSTVVDYSRAAGTLSATLVLVLVASWALLRSLPRNLRLMRSGILLGERADRDTGYLSAAHRPDLVGRSGVALTDLRPAGTGRFEEERVDVVAENGWIPAGTGIRVVRSEGYRNVVLPE
ncbi:MAG TPA: NfeD family protein, partial [Longimicrobiales bacterium]|nr:NfeD family protein [Longimicrobiales bacterium]